MVAKLCILFVAALHLYFMWMEMFAWTTVGKKTFKMLSPDLFEKTKILAANQGLYNGFLSAGLIWSIFIDDVAWQVRVGTFFLCCVITAGLYGWYSVHWRLFIVQGLPALIALIILQLLH